MFGIGARSAKGLGAAALALALGTLLGCADGPDEPAIPAASRPASTLHADLVEAKAPVAIASETGASGNGNNGNKGGSPAPKVIYLVYADGKTPLPATNYDACSGLAPRFTCSFGTSLLDCQQQVQAYLDRWYADFNVIFTLTRPTSGSFYTEVVSSGGGAWCDVASTVAGVAPFLCQDLHGGVAYTLDGGANAHDTAVIIAQEQAHLIGLEHVSDDNDIMYPYICKGCDGFENQAVAVTGDRCDRQTQNSYQMMMAALGPWGGGPKPSAFGCMNDTAPPVVSFVSPSNNERMGHDFAVKVDAHDDCDLSGVTVSVEPQGLSASASKGPYEWDLTGIDGNQTITVTAADGAGHTTVATLAVFAPSAGQYVAQPGEAGAGGCTMASGAFGAAGLLPSLAMLLLFVGRARRPRRSRRRVPGALAG
ncbi:MAG TPA: Ig-like domain-containing protein [Polyangia bacterium]